MSAVSLDYVRVEIDEGIAELTISRPKALNALNVKVLANLEAALEEVEADPNVRCVILTGDGKSFVAGADIAEMSDMTPEQAREFSARGQGIFSRLEHLSVPVLAAVNGFALGGGCELALACDVIYASERAKFGQPEVKLGLMPGFGGAVRLPRKVGGAAAMEWILTGEIYNASTARDVGLVREVLPPEELLPHVRRIAETIAKRAPLAVKASKQVVREGLAVNPASAMELEREGFARLFSSDDMREGTRAFLEKRDPNFEGR